MIIFIIALVLVVLGVIYHYLTKRYLNPYKLIFVFGKKGSGKSTLLEKIAYQHQKNGWEVYSTEATEQNGYHSLNPRKLYEYSFPPRSVCLIDEASLIWDNRDFKNMDKKIVEWFRYQRHHEVKVYLFSQSFDIDKKLRDLTDEMFIVQKYARVLVRAKRILRKPIVVHPSPEAPARIDEDLIVDGPLMFLFGGRMYAFIPYWAKRFDSFVVPSFSPSIPNVGATPLASKERSDRPMLHNGPTNAE